MHDINFFTTYRQSKSSSNGGLTIILIILAVVLVLNGLLIGLAYTQFSKVEGEIQDMKDYLNNPSTLAQLEKVEIVSSDVAILSQYHSLLSDVSRKFMMINVLDVNLIDYIRKLTPATTTIETSSISGAQIVLNCVSPADTDALDMYHAFLRDSRFEKASLSSINKVITNYAFNDIVDVELPIEQIVTYTFTITALLGTGGIQE